MTEKTNGGSKMEAGPKVRAKTTRKSSSGAGGRKTARSKASLLPAPSSAAILPPSLSEATNDPAPLLLTYVSEAMVLIAPEASPVPRTKVWEPHLDDLILRLDIAFELLEEKMEAAEAMLSPLPEDADSDIPYAEPVDPNITDDGTRFEPDYVVTDEMLARALAPAVWSDASIGTRASVSADKVVAARRVSIDRARSMLADLEAQATGRPLGTGRAIEEHLCADARLLDVSHPIVAARMRFASRELLDRSATIERTREDAAAYASLVLDYVPTPADRLAP